MGTVFAKTCNFEENHAVMTVERTTEGIVVKLPMNIDIEEIQHFLNYLRYKELITKSQATQREVDSLAKVLNKGWWDKNKDRFLPGE